MGGHDFLPLQVPGPRERGAGAGRRGHPRSRALQYPPTRKVSA
jgi:hypothetical protein